MLLTIEQFCDSVDLDMSGLVDELTAITGRSSPEERKAWEKSLVPLSRVLAAAGSSNADFGSAQLYIGELALEYRLPAASSWCDAVLLGKGSGGRPQAVIVELKHWDTKGDACGPVPGLIQHHGRMALHPSEQVGGYAEYCRRFHSAVLERKADVEGCVFFTRETSLHEYRVNPHRELSAKYPLFSLQDGEARELSGYLTHKLAGQDAEFAGEFVKGVYKQDRNILVQVAEALNESGERPFQLIDEQLEGFHRVMLDLKNAVAKSDKKHVIIVKGPPGSGKSALAVNVWIEASLEYNSRGNVVFVSTSSSQHTNWSHTFDSVGGRHIGAGMVLKANDFKPKLTPNTVKRLRALGYDMTPENWVENLKALADNSSQEDLFRNEHFLSIVDEAHALINPDGHKIGFPRGYYPSAGPQAYHIIKDSSVSIFLTDSEQSFRDSETTSVDDICELAKMLGASVDIIDLGGAQFRCAGSKEYVDWVEHFLGLTDVPSTPWMNVDNGRKPFEFEVVNTPFDLDSRLKELHAEGHMCRLLSSYSVPWQSKKCHNPHSKSDVPYDFNITVKDASGKERVWRRIWNYVPESNYSMFVQGAGSDHLTSDPTSEVGCPYVVRGFDFDYLGVLWLEDLVWRDDRWIFQQEHVCDSAFRIARADARNEVEGGAEELLKKVKRSYRILLTRALKGAFVYVHDAETREHLIEELDKCSGDPYAAEKR